ncbi:hypothetical protein BpHYR1_003244 [Brachionus plicatilis]|uniref:Uncharacterized protein n=1 Tax=Brachionus plicatilis TaxID=10195 RepID=A0A3M7T9T5_BRAPC|nr:hypothetical protein BpHYR1_003244 [Brachionus plicatilis]
MVFSIFPVQNCSPFNLRYPLNKKKFSSNHRLNFVLKLKERKELEGHATGLFLINSQRLVTSSK